MGRIADMMFCILRSQICNKELDTALVGSVASSGDLELLYKLSKHHDLAHIVGAALDKHGLLPEGAEISAKFRKQHFASIYRYKGIEYELEVIIKKLTEAGIKHIPLKGSVIRAYYPEPWMRTSCDIDVLVREEDLKLASKLLKDDLGYTERAGYAYEVAFDSPGGVHVELHYDLIEDTVIPEVVEPLREVWKYAECSEGGCTYTVGDDFFFFYHIAHTMKHFIHGGCGIRPFMDLWILENRVEYDKEKRDALLSRTGLLEFAEHARHLSKIWFEGDPSDEFYDRVAAYIFGGGAYGDIAHKLIVDNAMSGSKAKRIMRRIFVPYAEMRDVFPVLKKHKWLLPVFEVYRWIRFLFRRGRISATVNEIKTNNTVKEEDVKEIVDMFGKLGIFDNDDK